MTATTTNDTAGVRLRTLGWVTVAAGLLLFAALGVALTSAGRSPALG
jgi:hypothetical protein